MEKQKLNILFIGGGNIAGILKSELKDHIDLCWYYDLKKTDLDCQYLERFEIPRETDIVVECASVEAVKEFGIDILKSGKDFYIISSGAFADEEFRATFLAELKNSSSNVYIPSGAIGGIDIVRAVRNYVEKVVLTTKKPPKAFGIEEIQEPKTIFSGNAVEAIKKFPQNTNVSVTLSLALGSFEKVTVNVVADPNVNENIHEINIFSSVGNYTVIHKNKPSPNPKTSYLTPLSLAAAIKRNIEKFKIG
ncbi:aspartate dehydrogenase [Fervidobacterium riparium]|nr:aspartate dehydrogenase [Fervidobacterium riparium]